MTSSRPYLIRALHEWIIDNGLTPHIVVNAEREDVQVPARYIEDGKIILNVAPQAVRGLSLGNGAIEFSARFAGTSFQIDVPVGAVLAVYAKENGVGMTFQEEQPEGDPPAGRSEDKPTRPSLRVVK